MMEAQVRQVVTIDGLAGTGKSSLAKSLAARLNFSFLNSGAIYRVIGGLAIKNHVALEDEGSLISMINQHTFEFSELGVLVDGELVNPDGSEEIGRAASVIAAKKGVRSSLLPIQRQSFPHSSLVAEGRDMGTVVFPEAQVKIWVTVSLEERALRRAQQLGISDYQSVLNDLADRDKRDEIRGFAPSKPAAEAIIFDNSNGTFEEKLNNLEELVRRSL